MAKWPGGPCPGCAHSHGSTPCNVCGGGTGYPEHASPQLMDPCDTCIDSIGTTTQTGGPLSSEVDPDAPTDVTIAPQELLAMYESGTVAERVAAGLTEYAGEMLAATELTDPEAVDQILTIGEGLGPDELPEYRCHDVVADLVPRQASRRELAMQIMDRLTLLDGLDPEAARDAAIDALRMITDRYRDRAGS